MGRSPDYKAAFLGTLGGNAEFYAPFEANAKRWYTFCQERVPFVNHAIIHPPVDRDKPPDQVADVCVHVEKETDGGLDHLGREGRRDGLGAHELHVHRAPRPDSAAGQELRARVHAADERARREIPVPHVVRDDGVRDVEPVRSAAVVAPRRERRRVHHGQGVRAVGERLRLRRRREGQQLLPAHGLPAALRRARLHAARRQARLHRGAAAQSRRGLRHEGLPRRASQRRRSARVAQHVLGADRSDGPRSAAVEGPLPVAEPGPRQRVSGARDDRLLEDQVPDRADGRVGPDLLELARARFRATLRSGPTSTATCAAATATRPSSASSS